MTIKNRIRKLEQQPDQQDPFVKAYIEMMRAERIRLLDDPEALDRIRNEALIADGYEPLPPRKTP
jgi:hypothetical protein